MKRFLLSVAVLLPLLGLISSPAEAKRFGGGSSIGKQRSISPQRMQQATPSKSANAPSSNRSRWLGPLAGLAAALGLAALFSSLGLSEGMGMLLLLVFGGMLLMFLMSMMRRKTAHAGHYAGAQYAADNSPFERRSAKEDTVIMPAPVTMPNIPADFPVDAFLRSAKTSFIRLQAANDRKDLDDIREYTTPEMFAEISVQLQERGDAPQRTDVMSLNTELLEVHNEGDYAIASVHMTGQLSENRGSPEIFDEVWHVQKDMRDDNAVWLLAGIQQVS